MEKLTTLQTAGQRIEYSAYKTLLLFFCGTSRHEIFLLNVKYVSGIWFCEKSHFAYRDCGDSGGNGNEARAFPLSVDWWLTEAHGIAAPKNETNGGPDGYMAMAISTEAALDSRRHAAK